MFFIFGAPAHHVCVYLILVIGNMDTTPRSRLRTRERHLRSSNRRRSRSGRSRGRRSRSLSRGRASSHRSVRRRSRCLSRNSGNRSRRDRSHSSDRRRHRSRSHGLDRNSHESWHTIVSRLQALETRTQPPLDSAGPSIGNGTAQIVEAIQSLKSVSSQSYYVSNFDPNIHDVDSWFDEVDRAKLANRWDDCECLARIGNCLRGDAKSWIDEWVTSDRSWSNFKKDFKPLCVKKIDIANVLFQVMSTDSDKFLTYADYARKSLMRLRIVKGISNELITAIVLRGIKDPHVKATATNANLAPDDLVNYLSTFSKPDASARIIRQPMTQNDSHNENRGTKRPFRSFNAPKCFSCGESGHKLVDCPKKPKPGNSGHFKPADNQKLNIPCAYCKKSGHHISKCFSKERTEQSDQNN